MARVLIVTPDRDFDPTEAAAPWAWLIARGHDVAFASDSGGPATADPVTLTGQGLPTLAKSLRARLENRDAYARMAASEAFQNPERWVDVDPSAYDALLLPGGHAPGMRPYCESADVARIAAAFFAARKPVAAICHGVLPLARAGLLKGRQTTGLTAMMEKFAISLTRSALGDHYRTYKQTVEVEARAAVGPNGAFHTGPLFPRYATQARPDIGFVMEDGHYLSARWPGDAWTLARKFTALIEGAV